MRADKLLLVILALLAVLFTGAGAIYLISRPHIDTGPQEAAAPQQAEKPSQQASAPATASQASKPAEPATPERPATRTPKYDVVRIEKGGEGVIAGKAEPGWKVIIEASGEPVAEATADRDGEWAVVLSKPLPAGEHSLSLHAYSPDGNRGLVSDQTVVVSVAGKDADETVVALAEPGKATQVIQREQAQPEPQAQPKPQAETEAAKTPVPQPEAAKPAPEPEKPQAAAPPAPAAPAASEPAPAPAPAATGQAAAPQQQQADASAAPVTTPSLPGPAQNLASTPPAVPVPPPAAPAETTVAKSTPGTGPAKPSAEPKTEPAQQVASAEDKAKSQDKVASESTASVPQPAPSTQVARAVPADERPAPAQKSAPEPAAPKAQVVFDAVDYEDSGEAGKVFLSGEAEPGAQIMIYLNNDLIAQATAGQDGKWTVEQDQRLDPGAYVLRADQVREGGKVVSRAEVTFERAAPQAVVASLAEAQETMKAKQAEEEAAAAPQRQSAAPSASEPGQTAATPKPRKKRTHYLVRRGDTLWDIAEQLYGAGWRYTAIFKRNRGQIRDPDLIYPNQSFRLR